MHCESCEATEIRFWCSNLNEKIIKENYKQPLAMLYEQKRAIKIRIRKKEQKDAKKEGGLKKLGTMGLKRPSALQQRASIKKVQEIP